MRGTCLSVSLFISCVPSSSIVLNTYGREKQAIERVVIVRGLSDLVLEAGLKLRECVCVGMCLSGCCYLYVSSLEVKKDIDRQTLIAVSFCNNRVPLLLLA